MSSTEPWMTLQFGSGPVIAMAVHAGHGMRDELRPYVTLSDDARLREEDPFTDRWTRIAPHRVVVHASRFEVDLNRTWDKSVYQQPEDAWGLQVWNEPLVEALATESRRRFTDFRDLLTQMLDRLLEQHPRLFVFDLHSYNHRRAGPQADPEDFEKNPEINIGTGTMDRGDWSLLIDRFIDDLRSFDFSGRGLDVRENVRFQGGELGRWLHQKYPRRVCCLAIEVKKIFMDEWTGEPNWLLLDQVQAALAATLPGLHESLANLSS